MNIKYCHVDAAIFILHKNELRKVFASFDDDRSREIYLTLLKHRIKGELFLMTAELLSATPSKNSSGSMTKSLIRMDSENSIKSSLTSEPDYNTEEIKVVAIDDVLPEGCTFIKADIESYEYKMLLGAAQTIKKFKPRLAVCIYHNAVDFYYIPLLVKELCPDYKLMIRHHSLKSLT